MTLRYRIVRSVVVKSTAADTEVQVDSHVSEVLRVSDVFVRFGKRLREVRQRKGVSQEKLAELAGLHRTYVSSVERGERNISLLNISKLAEALGVPPAKLMPG
jgi:ribosome-binding protein aMBF1 (putative translation factor)